MFTVIRSFEGLSMRLLAPSIIFVVGNVVGRVSIEPRDKVNMYLVTIVGRSIIGHHPSSIPNIVSVLGNVMMSLRWCGDGESKAGGS